ncbi:MAG: 50S ribosomal protein L25/general stress protein Ctc [Arenicellales bacterium]|jgi:large subunit ribosomal protein L25
MSSEEFVLSARVRARTGTGLVRRLRNEGEVPAILYGAGKENLSIAVNHDVLFHSLDKEEFHSAIITIDTDGTREQAILRSVQRHPHKIKILHADFQRIDDLKPITMSLPIHFIGEEECVGVKEDAGMISHLMNEVEVTCLPKDLPENIQLDVTNLHLGESLHLSNIELPEGVQITAFSHGDEHEHDNAVVAIQAQRVEEEIEEEVSEAEEGEVTAEGEEATEASEEEPGEG